MTSRMTARERVLAAIGHRQPDRVPVDLGATPSSGISAIAYGNLKRHLGITSGHTRVYDVVQQLAQPEEDVLKRFGVDVLDVGRTFNPLHADWYDIRLADGQVAQYPAWFHPEPQPDGSFIARHTDGTDIAHMPAAGTFYDQSCFPYVEGYPADFSGLDREMGRILWSALAHSPWDHAGDPGFWSTLRERALALRASSDRALMIVCGCNLFEWGTFLRRMDNFLMDIYAEPESVERLLEALMERHLVTLEKVCAAVGDVCDILRFGDDLGMDSGPFMSPELYRKLFKPRHRQLCAYVHQHSGMKTFLHSCGSIYDLMPDLIEAGYDVINPVQTTCRDMEPEKLKREFGREICFWGGGCDTRTVLNRGTPAEVKEHVWRRLDILTPGGGFVFNTIHNILPEVPPENIVAMYEAVESYGEGSVHPPAKHPCLGKASVALAMLLGLAGLAQGNVTLHPLFTDGAVFQRGQPVPVWGVASPGEGVAVSFMGQTADTVADATGRWDVRLAPRPASSEPCDLVVKGANTLTVRGIVVGDVWLASGQSNMATPLSSGSATQALPEATDPLIRFFTVEKRVAAEPQTGPTGKWEVSSPEAARHFSAVAYFFAREIRAAQRVPVAILNASWGGTPIKTWMSAESLQGDPAVAKTLAEWRAALARHHSVTNQPQLMESYYRDMRDWETNIAPAYLAARKAYDAEAAASKAAGRPLPRPPQASRPEPEPPDPMAMPAASKRPSTPAITYNAMIAPLAPSALKGVLWYQGEADASRGLEYRALLPRLISGWRAAWQAPALPFLVVQLPSCGKDSEPVATKSGGIAWLREAQAMAARMTGVDMAVTLDIGDPDNVHPDNKVFVGQRLARLACAKVYGGKIVGSGPVYRDCVQKDGAIRVRFSEVGGGLVVGSAPWRPKGVPALRTDKLLGFYIAGTDRKWVEADAKIEGDTVAVSASAVPAPVAVRYGWSASPRVNLYNKEGLPAAPFRTDEQPIEPTGVSVK